MDYKNGKVYKIVNSVDDSIYIGSTCQPLAKRFYEHKKALKTFKYPLYNHMELIGLDLFDIVLVEEYQCDNKDQLHAREEHWRKELGATLNARKCHTGLTQQEYNRQYYAENFDKLIAQKKQYYEDHREERIDQMKEYGKQYREENKEALHKKRNARVVCECGATASYANLASHKRSAKHKNAMSMQ